MNTRKIIFFYNHYVKECVSSKKVFEALKIQIEQMPGVVCEEIDLAKDKTEFNSFEVLGLPTLVLLDNNIPKIKIIGEMDELDKNRIIDFLINKQK